MHQPIATEDEAQTDFYPQMFVSQHSGITLHTVYTISQDEARKIVARAIAEHERKFSVFGVVSVVVGGAIGFGIFWMMGG